MCVELAYYENINPGVKIPTNTAMYYGGLNRLLLYSKS
jgi:hypothetical protein